MVQQNSRRSNPVLMTLISNWWRFVPSTLLSILWPIVAPNAIALYALLVLTYGGYLAVASQAAGCSPGGVISGKLLGLMVELPFLAIVLFVLLMMPAVILLPASAGGLLALGLGSAFLIGGALSLLRLWPVYAAAATRGWSVDQETWTWGIFQAWQVARESWYLTQDRRVLRRYGWRATGVLLLLGGCPIGLALALTSDIPWVLVWAVHLVFVAAALPYAHLAVVTWTQEVLSARTPPSLTQKELDAVMTTNSSDGPERVKRPRMFSQPIPEEADNETRELLQAICDITAEKLQEDLEKMPRVTRRNPKKLMGYAIRYGNMEWFEQALKRGVQPDQRERGRDRYCFIFDATTYGRSAMVERFLDLGIEVDIREANGHSLLHHVASGDGSHELASLLLARGLPVDIKNNDASTPLMTACSHAPYDKIVGYLLEKGADPSARNKATDTPLIIAAGNGGTETVRLLINAGADVNYRRSGGYESTYSALAYAIRGYYYEIARILLQNGADPHIILDNGSTLLILAASSVDKRMVRLILDAGVDPKKKDASGLTAAEHVMWAERVSPEAQKKVVALIEEHTAREIHRRQ